MLGLGPGGVVGGAALKDFHGRRGVLICAMGAIDMALWDIKGQALGKPIYELLGGAVREEVTAYASLLGQGRSLGEYRQPRGGGPP